jgi:branched-chain amino acid aminotransferase
MASRMARLATDESRMNEFRISNFEFALRTCYTSPVPVILNGELYPDEAATIPVADRSFCYGDGLFETLRVHNRAPFQLRSHYQRLSNGAAALGIKVPYTESQLEDQIDELVAESDVTEAMVRVALSRGVGERGYSPDGADAPIMVITLGSAPKIIPGHPVPWRLHTSSIRLNQSDILLRHKTANRLNNVLAKAEAQQLGYDDALFLNLAGHLVEATCANLFWIDGNTVCTPPESAGALPGITRELVMSLCDSHDKLLAEENGDLQTLARADGAFLTLSSYGLIEIGRVDQTIIPIHELTRDLHVEWWDLVQSETR